MKRAPLVFATLAAITALSLAMANPTEITIRYEVEGFDLDVAETHPVASRSARDVPAGWDVRLAFNPRRDNPAVVVPNGLNGVEISILEQAAFADVGGDDRNDESFIRGPRDIPFDQDTVLLVKTDTGALFKIGNPAPAEGGLRFQFERIGGDDE
ncbi:hypothetical protein ABI59_13430 [Acidobacteria bacterium Mor1]|nr:hypothetical protein ABI59_13430 [Acidobacteria bacterium Mor1]